MKRVLQRDENGCGMACVAMLAKRSYATSCVDFFRSKSGRGHYATTKQLQAALKRAGLKCSKKLVRLKRSQAPIDIQTDAILVARIDTHNSGTWHWVVWDAKRKKILDPLDSKAADYHITSYLAVYTR